MRLEDKRAAMRTEIDAVVRHRLATFSAHSTHECLPFFVRGYSNSTEKHYACKKKHPNGALILSFRSFASSHTLCVREREDDLKLLIFLRCQLSIDLLECVQDNGHNNEE